MIPPMLSIIGVGFLSLIPSTQAQCSLSLLQAVTTSYISAQSAGRVTSVNVSSTGVYTENFKTAALASSILSKPLKIDSSFSIHDTSACASFTELIITDRTHPYVIGTQIRLPPQGESSEIQKIETIVTDQGDWLFNATGTLNWARQEKWPIIPEEKRDSREVIQAAADAYLNKFKDNSVKVPFNVPCARLEGGTYTGRNLPTDSCDLGFPTGVQMLNRRYVVDETLGSVDVFFNFGGPTHSPDSHLFRIEGGKIRYAHTMTVLKCNSLPEAACNAW